MGPIWTNGYLIEVDLVISCGFVDLFVDLFDLLMFFDDWCETFVYVMQISTGKRFVGTGQAKGFEALRSLPASLRKAIWAWTPRSNQMCF